MRIIWLDPTKSVFRRNHILMLHLFYILGDGESQQLTWILFPAIFFMVLQYCDRYGDYCEFPHLEQWRRELVLATLKNAEENLETYRDSWYDEEQLHEALQSPHFSQLSHI